MSREELTDLEPNPEGAPFTTDRALCSARKVLTTLLRTGAPCRGHTDTVTGKRRKGTK